MAGEPPCPDHCWCPPGTHEADHDPGLTRYTFDRVDTGRERASVPVRHYFIA